ncbi:MAG: hypothetical protein KAJ42_14555 [Gemmatimonadetes bacterium]|nr:hypothetical protein [Gemmatimonadota bacterium]
MIPKYAITLYPEWAFAIAWLGKDIENRPWQPSIRHVGTPIAIHAGATRRPTQMEAALSIAHEAGVKATFSAPDSVLFPEGDSTRNRHIMTRGIVAVATLARVVDNHESPWFFRPVPGDRPNFGWVLKNVVSFDCPVDVPKGQLGLWKLKPPLRDEIRRML